jgi:hypothetical protein
MGSAREVVSPTWPGLQPSHPWGAARASPPDYSAAQSSPQIEGSSEFPGEEGSGHQGLRFVEPVVRSCPDTRGEQTQASDVYAEPATVGKRRTGRATGRGKGETNHVRRTTNRRRTRAASALGLTFGALAISALFATSVFALVNDGGVVDVQVPNDEQCLTDTTNAQAIVTFLGEDNPCGDIGASGTGVFESFSRLHADGSEQGFNTDADKQLDNVGGTWTHSIKVSDIPVVSQSGNLYWELYADLNESNAANDPAASHISINEVEVFYTGNPAITGYPFSGTAEKQYDFEGDILINDVNSGSGRADIRYLIPLTNIEIPDDCGFKDPDCDVYFVLYSQWGTSVGFETEEGDTTNYPTDATFEEWKVKNYPYVTVEKTASTSFTRTYDWTIDKSVTPDTWNLFTGDTGTSQYTVAVTKGAGTDSAWAVSGTITITNPGDLDAEITSVTDQVSGVPTNATVVCPVSFPHVLPDGDSVDCTYSAPLPDGSSQTNTATVTLGAGTVFQGHAAVTFGSPTTTVNGTVHVTDSVEGSLGAFSATGQATYSHTFGCDGDEGVNDNTATIDETGQSDSAAVTVNCYALGVTKDADTSLTRTYHWSIDKSSSDPAALLLNPGETYLYHYAVTVDVTGHTDSGWAATGNIHVHNPAPIAATINSVTDAISGGITGAVVCGSATFPYTLAAGATLDCTYSANLPDATARTNTATATLQNHDHASDNTATDSGTTDSTGTANVSFANADVSNVDECVNVTDDKYGALGNVCVADAPKTFNYTKTFGPYTSDQCGEHRIDNTATFTTNDNGLSDDDSWEVVIAVPCQEGCTLTQGYWKTHSDYGPAKKSDPTWDLLPGGLGPDTAFYSSGKTWYETFWTAPKGNPYYILAHQYEAAVLNILAGAGSTTQVDATIASADAWFQSHSPSSTLTKAEKNQLTTWAGILGSYNEGKTGPGHCSEDSVAKSAPA